MIDILQRYAIVTKITNDFLKNDSNAKIMEIGSGGKGIARFIRKRIVGCDLQFHDGDTHIEKNLMPVRGSVYIQPFKNESIDILISVSMLEHIPRDKRNAAICEIARVAKKLVILSVPCGKKTRDYEEKLLRFYSLFLNHKWLDEHEKYGLPEVMDIVDVIQKESPSANIKVIRNVNLNLWFLTMGLQLPVDTLFWKYASHQRDGVLKIIMKLFGWILPIFDFGDSYQQVIIIKKRIS